MTAGGDVVARDEVVRLFLSGDVMLGRGVDQVLGSPGDPTLHESYVKDARTYVELAEQANGPVPSPVDDAWPWGEALPALDEAAPDVRVINLETSVTTSDDFAVGKAVNYRMHPGNVGAVAAVEPDVCVLANNHVLDFGVRGLEETLDTLAAAGLATAGAGRDPEEAQRPAAIPLDDGRRVLVFSFGAVSSGIPPEWQAAETRPGIDVLHEPLPAGIAGLAERVQQASHPGDLVIASIHWGSNWGHRIPEDQTRLAHALIESGVDVVHGHSSHHPRPIEVHRDRLVLYGCGDLVNDYEGIRGHEEYRSDLRLLYLVDVERDTGRLVDLRMVPLRARRLQLERASAEEEAWLGTTLDRVSRDRGAPVTFMPGGGLRVDRS